MVRQRHRCCLGQREARSFKVVDEKEEDEMREGGSDRLMRTNGTTVPGALAQGSLRERSRYI